VTPVADLMPSAPDWRLDWDAVDAAYPWIRALRGAPHDPVHHKEGCLILIAPRARFSVRVAP
jgi:hypothetical protein